MPVAKIVGKIGPSANIANFNIKDASVPGDMGGNAHGSNCKSNKQQKRYPWLDPNDRDENGVASNS
jgi:hypothetical protein